MSGHSKWSTIKHRKGAQDAKRGKIFTRIIKEIMVAARLGGGDPDSNPRLRTAISAARTENVPKDNIERAIKKGTGELEGIRYEEMSYEGYGPGGVAVIVEAMTDNRQRTVADVRHCFSKSGGSLGEPGSVAWMFEKKGLIVVEQDKTDEETLMSLALDAGADDLKEGDEGWELYTSPEALEGVKATIEERGVPVLSTQVTMIPGSTVRIDDERRATQVLKLMEALEENDDVQQVHANFDIPDEILEKVA
jgi:YebC/PmpR family DNA-binding regulatory protein